MRLLLAKPIEGSHRHQPSCKKTGMEALLRGAGLSVRNDTSRGHRRLKRVRVPCTTASQPRVEDLFVAKREVLRAAPLWIGGVGALAQSRHGCRKLLTLAWGLCSRTRPDIARWCEPAGKPSTLWGFRGCRRQQFSVTGRCAVLGAICLPTSHRLAMGLPQEPRPQKGRCALLRNLATHVSPTQVGRRRPQGASACLSVRAVSAGGAGW
jgi:hypothetical protein